MDADLIINITSAGAFPVLELSGEVDAYTCSQFRDALIKTLDQDSHNLIIDMDKVEYIDSSGLGALVGGLKRSSEKNGQIYIVCNNPQVAKVFEITGLCRVFPVYSNLDEAKDALAKNTEAVA